MKTPEHEGPLALIAGPTASGKTALALSVSEDREVTVINADSMQVYADLAVLTAQPSAEEKARAPHRLFGYLDGAEACSAARWAADATREIETAWEAGRLPLLVGGTGLYLRTLIEGIAPIPDIDPAIRSRVRAMDLAELGRELDERDPAAAQRLAPADRSRRQRALEVMLSTGRPIHEWRAEKSGGIGARAALKPLILLPPRDWLYERCDARFSTMIEAGAAEEVDRLAARGLDPSLPVMRAIGVPEIMAWRAGDIGREEMIERGRTATRQYAKRQYSWFRNQPPEAWPRVREIPTPGNIEDIITLLR